MIIEVHNISEYYEAIKKCTPGGRYFNKEATTLSWVLRDPFEFRDSEIRKIFGSNFTICDEALELLGKPIIYGGHRVGILRGVEITEEDFYWVIEDIDPDISKNHEISSSCVGRIDYLDLDLAKSATSYYEVEAVNKTPLSVAYIMGGIWREQHPSREMIKKILTLGGKQNITEEELDKIQENYK